MATRISYSNNRFIRKLKEITEAWRHNPDTIRNREVYKASIQQLIKDIEIENKYLKGHYDENYVIKSDKKR